MTAQNVLRAAVRFDASGRFRRSSVRYAVVALRQIAIGVVAGAAFARRAARPFGALGCVPWEEHGRPDESAALERIVDVLRGGYDRALPELNACQLARVERQTIEEYEREIADRALAELEAAGELPPGTYQIEMEGDEIPF